MCLTRYHLGQLVDIFMMLHAVCNSVEGRKFLFIRRDWRESMLLCRYIEYNINDVNIKTVLTQKKMDMLVSNFDFRKGVQ